jgi:signal peptidase I
MIENLTNISKTLILSSIIIIIIQLIFTSYKVNGDSMKPTLDHGDRVLVLKLNYIDIPFVNKKIIINNPKKDTIIAFKKLDEDIELVKRIIALPNEKIDIKNRTVFINDEIQERGIGVTYPHSDFPLIIQNNCIFVMGDNRNSSNDSRRFGCVPIENIDGQIALRVWPIRKFELFR